MCLLTSRYVSFMDPEFVHVRQHEQRVALDLFSRAIGKVFAAFPDAPHVFVWMFLEPLLGWSFSEQVMVIILRKDPLWVTLAEMDKSMDRISFLAACGAMVESLMLKVRPDVARSVVGADCRWAGGQHLIESEVVSSFVNPVLVLEDGECLSEEEGQDDDEDVDENENGVVDVVWRGKAVTPELVSSLDFLELMKGSLEAVKAYSSHNSAARRVLEVMLESKDVSQFLYLLTPVKGRPSIPVVNVVNDKKVLDKGFQWIDKWKLGKGLEDESELLVPCGCGPKDVCRNNKNCSCHRTFLDFYDDRISSCYDDQDRCILQQPPYFIKECNERCQCGPGCGLRVTQKPSLAELMLMQTPKKGWGVVSRKSLSAGTFVADYVGELIHTKEADARGQGYDKGHLSYLFNIDFAARMANGLSSQHQKGLKDNLLVLDAFYFGNISRFFNHSCDSNLRTVIVQRGENARMAHISFFTNRDVPAYEELTIDYNYEIQGDDESAIFCHCGASNCRQRLF